MFKFFHSPKIAKSLGWVGGLLAALGGLGVFGPYSALASAVGGLLSGVGVHVASNTGPAK